MSTGAANRTRGANAERAVVNYLRANGWPDARRYLAGDGRQPGDIDFAPGICLEVKDRAQSAWPTWRAQCVAEAGPNRIPIVVRRTRGIPDVGRWTAQIRLADWPDILPLDGWISAQCARTDAHWWAVTFRDVIDELRNETTLTAPAA